MGGRGARSGVSLKGHKYGTDYKTVLKVGNIKFVKYKYSKSAKATYGNNDKRQNLCNS